jgi:choline-sulfatase
VLVRFRGAWIAALGFAALAAVVEARWALSVATEPLDLARAWLASFGLLVPVALAAALLVSALWPLFGVGVNRATELSRTHRTAGSAPNAPPREIAEAEEADEAPFFWPLLGVGAAAGLVAVARLALAVWSLGLEPWASALSLALALCLLSRLLAAGFLALRRAPRLLARPSRWTPTTSLALAGLSFAAPIGYGIARGTPNGEGGFWAIFAVLARQELDLRAPALACGLLAAGCLGAWRQRAALGLLLVGTSFAAFAWVATALWLLADEPLALALERGGGLARKSLLYQRAVADRDGDGVAVLFGEHDCDDARAGVYPGAFDEPGDGVDADCSGVDAPRVSVTSARLLLPSAIDPSAARRAPLAAPRAATDLNVLLITVDTLRHDLGYAGYARPISPNIDRLARRSVVFDRAYSLASYTGKSVGPLLIGKYPSETHRGFYHFNRFGRDETFVQERLREAGVRTVSVQAHWYFTPEYGLGRGFDVLDLSASPEQRALEGDTTVSGDKLTDAAIAQLSRQDNTRDRFFMWVHYLDPHADYIRHDGFDFGPRGRDLYDSEVAFTDQQIGRLLDFVAASEFARRTAIVLTSDHGEAFGEHGMWRHGYELWEALVQVPLIAYVPGVEPHHVSVRRSGIDLAPTVLSLLGVALPAGEERLSGTPLTEDIFMPPGHVPEDRPVFVDMSQGPYNEERQALIENDIKLIMCTGRVIGLYDLARDPEETFDRRRDRPLLSAARARFVAFQRQLRWVRVNPNDASGAP